MKNIRFQFLTALILKLLKYDIYSLLIQLFKLSKASLIYDTHDELCQTRNGTDKLQSI